MSDHSTVHKRILCTLLWFIFVILLSLRLDRVFGSEQENFSWFAVFIPLFIFHVFTLVCDLTSLGRFCANPTQPDTQAPQPAPRPNPQFSRNVPMRPRLPCVDMDRFERVEITRPCRTSSATSGSYSSDDASLPPLPPPPPPLAPPPPSITIRSRHDTTRQRKGTSGSRSRDHEPVSLSHIREDDEQDEPTAVPVPAVVDQSLSTVVSTVAEERPTQTRLNISMRNGFSTLKLYSNCGPIILSLCLTISLLCFEILLSLRLNNASSLPLYSVFIPLWLFLLILICGIFSHIYLTIHRNNAALTAQRQRMLTHFPHSHSEGSCSRL